MNSFNFVMEFQLKIEQHFYANEKYEIIFIAKQIKKELAL